MTTILQRGCRGWCRNVVVLHSAPANKKMCLEKDQVMDGGGDAYANDNDVGEEDMDVEPQRDQEQPELGELFIKLDVVFLGHLYWN